MVIPAPLEVGDAVVWNGYNAFGVILSVNVEKGHAFVVFTSGFWWEMPLHLAFQARLSGGPIVESS